MRWVTLGWLVLVFAGLIGIAVGFWEGGPPLGIASIVAAVIVWIAYGTTTDHYLGLRRRVANHLGPKWDKGELLTHPIPRHARVDTQIALDAVRAASGGAVYGIPPPYTPRTYDEEGIGAETLVNIVHRNPRPEPLRFARLPASQSETAKVAENALYLLRLPDRTPFVVLRLPGRMEVLADTPEHAQAALDHVLDQARRRSVYRGRVVSLRKTEGEDEAGFEVEFHDLPEVRRDDIVLPEGVMAVIDRNVPGWLARSAALRKAGLATRHGVMLYGPPGTGKSLVVKYLAGSADGVTVILLTGRQLALVRESCRLARLLAPAILVIEDVDLIATDREQSRDTTLLHDLMDEMDGLGPRAEVIFLLTTNRPQVIERALASRPGRVDQAIAFPLPDRDDRRRLFGVFGRRLDLTGVDVEALLDRTDGASPAFLAELFRKAVVLADERGERSSPPRLTDADFDAAIRELVEFGGELTRNLLGYRANPER